MTFTIRYFPQAEAFLNRSEKQLILRIRSKIIHILAENPFCTGSQKIKGTESAYRYRIGGYRVLYRVDTKNKILTVYNIGRRENIYN